jgi:hypothetical protein
MRLRRQTALPPLLFAVVLVACDGRTTAPSEPAATLAQVSAPAAPGLVVSRGVEDFFFFLVPDLAAGLTATIGTPDLFSAWCDPTAPVSVDAYSYQRLDKPTGVLGELLKGQDLTVIIYGVGTVEFCPDLDGAPVVARGTARLVEHDRDVADPPSYGYSVRGPVTLTAGGTARFSGNVNWVTTGKGEVRVHSQLTLTPGH